MSNPTMLEHSSSLHAFCAPIAVLGLGSPTTPATCAASPTPHSTSRQSVTPTSTFVPASTSLATPTVRVAPYPTHSFSPSPPQRAQWCASAADTTSTTTQPSNPAHHQLVLTQQQEEDAALAVQHALPVQSSPALAAPRDKYIFPMRANNTQVFFDHSISDRHTLMVVFANDHHGFVLDVLSVLKALGVKCWRVANGQDDALRLMLTRIEGEILSINGLDIHLQNCYAFWMTDEESSDKISDDPERLEQITACIMLELSSPNPRPTPVHPLHFHRTIVEHNRADIYTVFNVLTADRPKLLMELSAAFAACQMDVCSAAIQTTGDRAENTFFVRDPAGPGPLSSDTIADVTESIMRALLRVGNPSANETLWYQVRNGSAVSVAEALFIDQVCNKTLATFAKYETPNFRGRLPEAPYRPVSLQ